jgi:bacillopeptidase F (M6 metalloprotease family)/subtilisin family serine protease
MKQNRSRKIVALGMAFLLSLSMAPSSYAAKAQLPLSIDLAGSAPQAAQEKIDANLNELFSDDEYATYLVKLKEQTDTNAVSKAAQQKAVLERVTPSAAKLSTRTAVVSSLQETASRTQSTLSRYLEQEQAKGQVKEFKSFFIVNAMAVTSTKAVLNQIALLPEVERIVENKVRTLEKVDVTPETPKSPAVEKDVKEADAKASGAAAAEVKPSSIEWNVAQINAPEVWAKGIDGSGIVVANLDSGVDYQHPALKRKWRGLNASGQIVNPELSWYDANNGVALPEDNDGHGTHTMGTMVGSEADESNQVGVAPGAKWIAVRIFNPESTDAIILDAGQWLLAPVDAEGNLHPELAPDVVNNSWGSTIAGRDDWFRQIVQNWRSSQIFPEFSAGNVGRNNPGGPGSIVAPGNYPEAVATGAVDINGNVASFSLLGPSPYGEVKPEVSAPGVNIRSTVPGGLYEGGWNGTSMAGPHTAALAALLLQANHSLSVDQLEEIITSTATPKTDSTYPTVPNNGYGYGIINALDAVSSVLEGVGSVSGKVTTAGEDEEEPVLVHSAPAYLFAGLDAKLTAQVTDNVAVTTVEAYAKISGTNHYVYLPLHRTSGSEKDGVYETDVPAFLIDTQGLSYYFRVNDYGNNTVETAEYTVTVSNGVKPDYVQNFESDLYGFELGGTGSAWSWGVPASGPGKAYSGSKVVATNLSGTYAANSNSYIATPPIDLTGSPDGALLSFKQWYDLENNIDFGKVYIASEANGFEFEPLLTFTGTSGGWKNQYVDLHPYAGQQVFLMFNLTSDNTVQKAGWYIDDLTLQHPDHIAPDAPASLQGSADTLGNVLLSWSSVTTEDLKQYAVYRSTVSGSGYERIGITTQTAWSDPDGADGTAYYYTVAAQDYSGNESAKSNEVSVTVIKPVVIYSDSFDQETDNGWTHSGTKDEWERGVPKAPGPSAAVSAPNVWGTDLDNTYETGADYSLFSPVIDLGNTGNATLAFSHWYEFETNYDYGNVEITADGGTTWTQLGRFSSSTLGKAWSPAAFNLDAYAGQQVQLRFHVKSDNTVVKAGWYIDNVTVYSISTPAGTKSSAGSTAVFKEKPEYDYPQYKLIRTNKAEFLAGQKEQEASVTPAPASLPASATVTVLETGRSVKTDSATGRYTLNHAAGDYTLKAEAYGYYPQTRKVSITDGVNTRANFQLEAIPHGLIHGVVTDERSGEVIPGAAVKVANDPHISPVQTAPDGTFTLDVLEGDYTLDVTAVDYYSKSITVHAAPNQQTEVAVSLKPFIGYEGEIGYDDGTPENAHSFNASGNAWAVRITPQSDAVQVTGASFRFWNTEWPVPGGTDFQYAVYDASGAGGAPGKQLAGPFNGTALRNNQWTTVTLAEPVTAAGDFYIVYIQVPAGTSAPGLATDESGPNAGRSWQRASGAWSQSAEDEGNYMIRAIVRYPVNAPVITSPADGLYTRESTVTVNGTLPLDGAEIRLYNGTELAGTAAVAKGQFNLPVELLPGANALSAEAVVRGKRTDRSEPVVVTLDQTPPTLQILSPLEGARTNAEVVTVTGTLQDEHPGTLSINGEAVTVASDNTFSRRILVNAGLNLITVTAADLAANTSTVTRAVYVDLALPEIRNITPASDVHLKAGEKLTVAFDSAPGLQAGFHVELPLAQNAVAASEIPLTETVPGHYEASYTIPSGLVVNGGIIVIRVRDAAGNEASLEAPGRLYAAGADSGNPPPSSNKSPVAVITAPDNAKKKKHIDFNATASRDQDGTIVSYAWQFSDGGKASGIAVTHRFEAAGQYLVKLTVTDNQGAQNTTEHTITIK